MTRSARSGKTAGPAGGELRWPWGWGIMLAPALGNYAGPGVGKYGGPATQVMGIYAGP